MRNALRKEERELAKKLAPEAVEPPEGLLARLKADIPEELPAFDRQGARKREAGEEGSKVLRFPALFGALGGSTALKVAATVALALGGGFLALQVRQSTPDLQIREAEEAMNAPSQAPVGNDLADDLGEGARDEADLDESGRAVEQEAHPQTRSGGRVEPERSNAPGRMNNETSAFADSLDRLAVPEAPPPPPAAPPPPPAAQPAPEPEGPIFIGPSSGASPPPPPPRPASPSRRAAPQDAKKDSTWVGAEAPLTFRGGSPRAEEDEESLLESEMDPELQRQREILRERLRQLPPALQEAPASADLDLGVSRRGLLSHQLEIRDLEIQVRHEEGEALPGAVLHLEDAEGNERTAIAGAEGRAYFYDVPVGEYKVKAELDGFQKVTRNVSPPETEKRELELNLPIAALQEEIVVVGERVDTISQSTASAAPLWAGDGSLTVEPGAPMPDGFGRRADRPPVPENPLVDTADDSKSTFGLDVDTGSYGLLRRHLSDGTLPDPSTVRIEELLNAFDYGDPAPTRGDFAITAQGAPSPFRPGLQLLRLGIKAREVKAEDRKSAALTFVVDVSGSMQEPDKLDLAKQALGLLLDQLQPGDTVALVTYGSEAQVVLPHTADKEAVRRALDDLGDGGSTNAEAGLMLGYQEARKAYRPDAVNRIVLCSDGVANVGVTDSEGLLDRVGREARRGIELTTLGFGMGEYNDRLMEQLADNGDGRYAYLDDLIEAHRVLVEELTGTVQTIARDARVQFELNPRTVKRYRLLGYENRDIADHRFRYDEEDAGEIGSGHAVTVLYEMELEPAVADTASLGILRLRWWSVEQNKFEEIEQPVYRRDLASSWPQAAPALRWAALTTRFAQALRGQASMRELPQLADQMHGLAAQTWSSEARRAEMADMVQFAKQVHDGILERFEQATPQDAEDP